MAKKKVHLICNAHLDPIWQWDWQEGASAAISTFQAAANLAEEFDYVFCHNEVVLYQYIEQYAPQLFRKIHISPSPFGMSRIALRTPSDSTQS